MMKRQDRFIKATLVVLLTILMFAAISQAEERKPEHLLDGFSMNYFYQTGGGIHITFDKGMANYEWITGPRKGRKGEGIPYKSRKIGDQLYIVNWHQPVHRDFLTFVFNLKENIMYSSAILMYGTENQKYHFSGGIIEHVKYPDK